MPPLTWRDVVAGNLGGALEGTRTAADLFNRAIGQAQQTVDTFGQAQTDTANQNILNRMLATQDPAEYARKLAAGEITGADAQFASPEMMLRAEARQDALRGRAMDIYQDDRRRSIDAEQDALASRVADATLRIAQGDKTAFRDAVTGVKHLQTAQGMDNYLRNFLPNPADVRADQAREDQRLLGEYIREFRLSPTEAAQRELSLGDKYPAHIVLAGEQILNQRGENATAGVIGSNATLGITGPLVQKNYAATSSGDSFFGWNSEKGASDIGWVPDKPISQMTYAERLQAADGMIAATKGKGYGINEKGEDVGTSAMGRYMLTAGTVKEYGDQIWGKGSGWETKIGSVENDRQIAEAVFNDRKKKGDMTKTWVVLDQFPEFRGKGKLANRKFDEIEPLITYLESNEVPANYLNDTAKLKETLDTQKSNFTFAEIGAYNALQNPTKDVGAVVSELAASLGAGKSPKAIGELTTHLKEAAEKMGGKGYNLSPSEVAAALRIAVEHESWWNDENYADGLDLDDADFKKMLADMPVARTTVQDVKDNEERLTRAQAFQATHAGKLIEADQAIARGQGSKAARHLKVVDEASKALGDMFKLSSETQPAPTTPLNPEQLMSVDTTAPVVGPPELAEILPGNRSVYTPTAPTAPGKALSSLRNWWDSL